MIDEDRCTCCDLPAYSCGTVLARRQAEDRRARAQRALEEYGVVRARNPGRCPCGSLIAIGEPIRKTEDGWTSVMCCPQTLAE